MAAIYLVEDAERLKKITDRTAAACNRFINGCCDDGTSLEGVGYWMYAMHYYLGFDELLLERTGESIIEDTEKFKRIAAFPSKCCFKNTAVKFSDCSENVVLSFGVMCRLNERFGVAIPPVKYYEKFMDNCARACGAIRNIAWFKNITCSEPEKEDCMLDNAQWYLHKNGETIFVMKGGNNAEPHNHNDIGSFMYAINDAILADELGSPEYTREYFGKGRYNVINASSSGHSVPIVNGQHQLPGGEYRADIFKRFENGAEVSFADAYDKTAGLVSLRRRAQNGTNDEITITDIFEFAQKNNNITERIITRLKVEKTGSKTVIFIKEGDVKGKLTLLTDGEIHIKENASENHDGTSKTKFNIIDIVVSGAPERFCSAFVISK